MASAGKPTWVKWALAATGLGGVVFIAWPGDALFMRRFLAWRFRCECELLREQVSTGQYIRGQIGEAEHDADTERWMAALLDSPRRPSFATTIRWMATGVDDGR